MTNKEKLFKFVEDYECNYIVVEFKNNDVAVVVNGKFIYKNKGFDIINECYDDNLDPINPSFTDKITKIYCGQGYGSTSKFDFNRDKLLWERNQVVELTMDQIAEKFGINVKNLKIKK